MPSIVISPFPEHESGIKTIFNHFRNTHARYYEYEVSDRGARLSYEIEQGPQFLEFF
jgi:hypothetical protein